MTRSTTQLETALTSMVGCRYPIIVGPMFLVSNREMVVAASEAGAIGSFPALNFRPPERVREVIRSIRSGTDGPFAVNVIVNPSNIYKDQHIEICLEEKVPIIIASLGGPRDLIEKAHAAGTKVFVDVIDLHYAKKAEAAGADAIIAVNSGAGGHRGNIAMEVLIPYLRKNLSIPVIAAGGIADGQGMAAALALGACGVQCGTRFIASTECAVIDDYKTAIIKAGPGDIVTTYKMDGVAAHVLLTDYIKRVGTNRSFLENQLFRSSFFRRMVITARTLLSLKTLEASVSRVTWKQVWGAGQVVGLIDDVQPIGDIIAKMIHEYTLVSSGMPKVTSIP